MMALDELKCAQCSVVFGVQRETLKHLRQSSQSFYCTFGHSNYYPQGESEQDRLRRERDRLKQQLAERDDDIARERRKTETERQERRHAERRVSAYRGQVTKIKNRVAAGTCPCCNRTFQNLARHMSAKHPDFRKEDENEGAS